MFYFPHHMNTNLIRGLQHPLW